MKRTMFSLKIDQVLRDRLQELKEKDGRSLTYHIERAISNYLKIKLDNCLRIPKEA
jgi:predicted transcriptional regulator